MVFALAGLFSVNACERPDGIASAADMKAAWQIRDHELEIAVQSPGTGWLVIGLHDAPGLAGTHLAMLAIEEDGTVRVEHHLGRPPRHDAVNDGWIIGAEARRVGEGVQATITFNRHHRAVGLPEVEPGSVAWLTLAWSRHTDFDHHSAQREEVAITW